MSPWVKYLRLELWYYDSENGNLKCPKCDRTFKNYLLTYTHVKDHDKIPCSTCGKMLESRRMSRHVLAQHGKNSDRKHQCTLCSKGFMTKPSLQDHMNIHTGARPYMCSFCSMTFASCGTHRMHEKAVHLGKKRNLQKKSHKNGIINWKSSPL